MYVMRGSNIKQKPIIFDIHGFILNLSHRKENYHNFQNFI